MSLAALRTAVFASLVAGLLVPRAAAAGTTIVFRTNGVKASTWYYEQTRVRVQNLDGANEDTGVIVDAREKKMVYIYDDQQAFFDVGRFLKKMRKQLAPFDKLLRARGPDDPETVYVPSREKRTVNGFPCEMYQGFEGGHVTEEICAAPWNQGPVGATDYRALGENAAAFARALFGIRRLPDLANAARRAALPGLPVWRQPIAADRTRGAITEIESITVGELPAAIFSVPAGYHEVDQPLDQARGRTAAAPEAARVAPTRDEAARRFTGVIVLLLLAVATLGLLFHAWLVHLAAGFVLEEPRYINAVVATLVVWIVGVPIELLGIAPVAALPVGLLATYAGLKLSYGASRWQTIALLVVSMIVVVLAGLALGLLMAPFRR